MAQLRLDYTHTHTPNEKEKKTNEQKKTVRMNSIQGEKKVQIQQGNVAHVRTKRKN